jgi:excinuclease UvrABC nuclease subunit
MTEQENFIEQLVDGTSKLMIENGEKMYSSLRQQNYEEAARLRDQANEIIEVAAQAFAKNITGASTAFFKEHFTNQVKYISDELKREFGDVI